MDQPDIELLKRYAGERSREEADAAFAELVRRHLGLVYSAAMRQVRSPELAEEVAQCVFLDLAKNASRLNSNTVLSAWLYQVARRTAVDVVRRESRRQAREHLASEFSIMNTNSPEWTEIEPLLDEAMEELEPEDRTAVLLRFFERKSLREVGSAMGTSENAAQKRLSRAIERLNRFFTSRGVRVGASGLAAAITSNGVQAAPAALAANICAVTAQVAADAVSVGATSALASASAAGAGSGTAMAVGAGFNTLTTTIQTMTAIQKLMVALSLAAVIGTGVYHSQSTAKLRQEVKALESAPGAEQLDGLKDERDAALARAMPLQAEVDRLKANQLELLRLRDEVTRLRRATPVSTAADTGDARMEEAAKNWLSRLNTLKQRLELSPQARIPEMDLLTEEDWLAAVKGGDLTTEEDFRKAFASLRNTAQTRFAKIAHPALSSYLKSNGQKFPTDVSELLAHMEPPVNPAMLDRYAILPESTVPNVKMGGDWAITQKAPVDQEYDQRLVIGPNGYGTASYPKQDELVTAAEIEMLMPALREFSAMNGGKEPTDPSQLEPYVKTAQERAALEKVYESRTRATAKRN